MDFPIGIVPSPVGSFLLLSYKIMNETNVKVGAKRPNSSLFLNEFLSPYF
jgi:hypothetical protein